MRVKVVAAALLGILAFSSLLVGASYGDDPARAEGPSEPTVLELYWRTRHQDSEVWIFLMDPNGGRCDEIEVDPVCIQFTEKDMPLFDVDGNRIDGT